MRAIVTGATGFLGNALVQELSAGGWDILCLCRRRVRSRMPSARVAVADLLHPASLRTHRKAFVGADVVFHVGARLPGRVDADDFAACLTTNGAATAALTEIAVEAGVPRFVYASSISVVETPTDRIIDEDSPVRPTHPYSISKLAGELWCEATRGRDEGLNTISLRITSLYGPGMAEKTILPRWARLALEGGELAVYGTGGRTQNFLHVRDAVSGLLAAAQSKAAGVFCLGGAESISMRDLAVRLVELGGCTGARVAMPGTPDPQEMAHWQVDINRARSLLGYTPTVSLVEGLREYLAFLQSGAESERWYDAP